MPASSGISSIPSCQASQDQAGGLLSRFASSSARYERYLHRQLFILLIPDHSQPTALLYETSINSIRIMLIWPRGKCESLPLHVVERPLAKGTLLSRSRIPRVQSLCSNCYSFVEPSPGSSGPLSTTSVYCRSCCFRPWTVPHRDQTGSVISRYRFPSRGRYQDGRIEVGQFESIELLVMCPIIVCS